MRLDELMGLLQTFELNLKMNKKEKSIAFQVDHHDYPDEGNDSDDNNESLVLLTKNFNRFLKKMNKKNPQSSKRFVDVPFCPGYLFCFIFFIGLWARLCLDSSLGLEPIPLCCLFYFIESLGRLMFIYYSC